MNVQTASLPQRQPATDTSGELAAPQGYQLIAKVGEGAFAEIWSVRHLASGKKQALKRLRANWHNHPVAMRLFANEADVAAAVRSRYVVEFVHAEANAASPFVVMEWLEGRTLEVLLNDEGKLSPRRATWIARQMVEGLGDLCRAGFAHGDVKPTNVWVAPSGQVKLIDLGFARRLESGNNSAARVLTGTPQYMAPETLTGEESNAIGKDIYSLGVTLFRMLTGRLPFQAEATADVLRLQRESRPPLVRRWCPTAPRELAEFVSKLLAKQPLRRPTNYGDVIAALIKLELAEMKPAVEQAA